MIGDGRKGRSGFSGVLLAALMAGLLILALGGCGGADTGDAETGQPATSSAPPESAEPDAEGEGVLVAKKILAAFDELVGEVAALAKDTPDSSVLKPQLEELYASYVPKMTELNGEYLALRDADVAQFGACNEYLGEYRGKHVFEKDNVLTEPVRYYNLEVGDQEMVSLLSSKPVELLDIAVKQ